MQIEEIKGSPSKYHTGGKPKDDLVNRPYLIEKTTRGGGGQKSPILRRHSLWTAPKLGSFQKFDSSKVNMQVIDV